MCLEFRSYFLAHCFIWWITYWKITIKNILEVEKSYIASYFSQYNIWKYKYKENNNTQLFSLDNRWKTREKKELLKS